VAAGDPPRAEPERQLISFSLHGEHYGLPIASVREIIRYTPPRVTATAWGLIRGMINLRGRVLPVVDLSSRLGQVLEVTDATRILVIEVSTGILGLIVDRVEGVMQIPVHRIEVIPAAVAGDALGHEVAAMDDRLIMLVDVEHALGGVLVASPPQEQAGEPPRTTTPRRRGQRADGPATNPPARRRSAATPQAPRSRRPPRRRGEGRGS
jgi:purine-binding chemotaxis protein CheW